MEQGKGHLFTCSRIGSSAWRVDCACGSKRVLRSEAAVVYWVSTGHFVATELGIPA